MIRNRYKPSFEKLDNRLLLDASGLIDLEVSVTPDRATAFEGKDIVYTVAVTNNAANATTAATGVVIATDVSSGLATAHPVASSELSQNDPVGWKIDDPIEPGETVTIDFTTYVGSVVSEQMSLWVVILEADQTDVDSTPGWAGTVAEDDSASGSVLYESPVYLGLLSGYSYLDANNDGNFDLFTELPLPGVEVSIAGVDSSGNVVHTESTKTDANGRYRFIDLPSAEYSIVQTQPSEFQDGIDTPGFLSRRATSNNTLIRGIDVGSEHSLNESYSSGDNHFGESGFNSVPALANGQNLLSYANDSEPQYYSIKLDASAILDVTASSGIVRVVDENLELVDTHVGGGDNDFILLDVPEGSTGQYYVQVYGDSPIADLSFDVTIPNVSVTAANTVTAVATMGDDTIELTLGEEFHELDINGLKYSYAAAEIDTFYIGGAKGDDEIIVNGTDADDRGRVLGYKGRFTSDAYHVRTYSAETTTYNGGGGNDRAQLFGSMEDDTFKSEQQASTMVTPQHVFNANGFERVDGYGRAGNDHAELHSTFGVDTFVSTESYTWLKSGNNRTSSTKGFESVEVIGHNVDDVAHFHGTEEDDSFASYFAFSELTTANRTSRVSHDDGVHTASVFLGGGDDNADFYGLDNDSSFWAAGNELLLSRADLFDKGTVVREVESVTVNELNEQVNPRKQLFAAIDFAFTENVNWA